MPITIEERIRLGVATPDELKSLGAARVIEVKSDPEHMQYRGCIAQRSTGSPDGYAPDRKILRLVASTHDKDHMGDRVSVRGKDGGKGWLLKDYQRQGGVYLWSHNMGSVKAPIGQAIKTWRGKITQDGQTKNALLQDVEFLSADDGPDDHFKFAETVFLLMSGKGTRSGKGMMGSSVGFVPRKAHSPKDKEEREKLGLGAWGLEFHEQVLLENSATPTPANPFAAVLNGKGGAEAKSFSFEAAVLEELKFLEGRPDLIDGALIKFFREKGVLGPAHAQEIIEAKLRSRVFIFDGVGAMPETKDGFDSVHDGSGLTGMDDAPILRDFYLKELLDEGHPEEFDEEGDDDATDHEPEDKSLDIVKSATADEDGTITLVLDVNAQDALGRAYEAADTLTTVLGGLVDAVDKSTSPELVARGVGGTLEGLAAQVADLTELVRRSINGKATPPKPTISKSNINADAVLSALGINPNS